MTDPRELSPRAEELYKRLQELAKTWTPPEPCDGNHRGPQGPNEDLAVCYFCHMPTWTMRPDGEEFGGHISDCSLPRRHESFCVGGGTGHPPPRKMRG